ncbi:hypothetical protein DCS_06245 [Drechmeria coniospora]|uniref:Uncharacterized protein n=1 Tax=Drechmeria coniospora TaxID=98403 RepID=A0A151GB07_DRECN|nr:hypothetical protein DCS_06245 [Drechmeria coniospora]KYK54288.1 hypothetical protein DCS_06245 [Drechmeria coniospora]
MAHEDEAETDAGMQQRAEQGQRDDHLPIPHPPPRSTEPGTPQRSRKSGSKAARARARATKATDYKPKHPSPLSQCWNQDSLPPSPTLSADVAPGDVAPHFLHPYPPPPASDRDEAPQQRQEISYGFPRESLSAWEIWCNEPTESIYRDDMEDMQDPDFNRMYEAAGPDFATLMNIIALEQEQQRLQQPPIGTGRPRSSVSIRPRPTQELVDTHQNPPSQDTSRSQNDTSRSSSSKRA